MLFCKQVLTIQIILSQKPPHHGARSTIYLHVIFLSVRYCCTSMERVICFISLDADLKVDALSEIMVAGKPRHAVNLWNVVRKELTSSLLVNSR